jgi:hypothetical protein
MREGLEQQIKDTQQALAVLGAGAFSQVWVTYPILGKKPSPEWLKTALAPLGVDTAQFFSHPHREGDRYSGLLIYVKPVRQLPEPWIQVERKTFTGTILEWMDHSLNDAYAEWCKDA